MHRSAVHRGFAIPVLIFTAFFAARAQADGTAPYVWLEGEAPTDADFEYGTGGWGNAHYLSDDSWLHFSVSKGEVVTKAPNGLKIKYDFTGEGDQNARYGFNFPIDDMNRNQGVTMRFDYPMKGAPENGLLDRVDIDDIYAIPNVEEMRLKLEISLVNMT